ncbi:MAG: transglutaminase domain-containing protein [Nitrososphaerales archaeon]
MNRKVALLFLLFTLIILSCITYPAFSAPQYYKVLLFDEKITVIDSKIVYVSLNYKFMPLLSEGWYYKSWPIYLNTKDAYGIIVQSEYGLLPFNVSLHGNWTKLDIDLKRRVYSNQAYLLKISYFARDSIKVLGPEKSLGMWTVTDDADKENVTLTINIPKNLGVVKYEPTFLEIKEGANGTILSGQRLKASSDEKYYLNVILADTVAQYNITYRYIFVNQGSSTESSPEFEVSGPIASGMQEVSHISYNPLPISTSYDESGNLRVRFKTPPIAPRGSITITISFLAKITLPPAINDLYSGGLDKIPSNLMKYTTSDKYWEVNDVMIKSLSQKLTKNETSVLKKVKAIYNYVINNIEYDYAKFQAILRGQKVERYGAVKTLTLRRGVCGDISDLFVTLCRASGIPAFVAAGPTYIKEGIIFRNEVAHAWTEVYIPGYGWLQVDPTWKLFGRLEGRHIIELLKKESSEPKYIWWYVYQPFSYKVEYDIKFLTKVVFKPKLIAFSEYKAEIPFGSTLNLKLVIRNYGNGTAYATDVSVITPKGLVLLNKSSFSLDKLREFEFKSCNLIFNATSLGKMFIFVIIGYKTDEGKVEVLRYNYSVTIIKALSTISCSTSSPNLIIGDSLTIFGSIIPARAGVIITISYKINGSDWNTLTTIKSTSNGSYLYLWKPSLAGSYQFKASWLGDNTYNGAESNINIIKVSKIPTKISCFISPTSISINSHIIVSGSIIPARAGVIITISYKMPNSTIITRTVTSTINGKFNDTYTPRVLGLWSVKASLEEDRIYLGATSSSVTLTVSKIPVTISYSISPSKFSVGGFTTISGSISPPGGGIIILQQRVVGGLWSILAEVILKSDGSFLYQWTPSKAGRYEIRILWQGDNIRDATTSSIQTITVEEKRCIIATAAYGSELNPHVQFLREFRENIVLKTFAGNQFMNIFDAWYYSFSPSIATLISTNTYMKAIVRGLLYPLIGILYLGVITTTALNFNIELSIIITGIMVSALIGFVYFTPIIIVPLYVVKKRKILTISYKSKILLIPWVISITIVFLGEMTSSILMMLGTGALVISTIALIIGVVLFKLADKIPLRK